MSRFLWFSNAKEFIKNIEIDERVMSVPDTTCRCCLGYLESYDNKHQLIPTVVLATIEKLRKEVMSEILDIDTPDEDKIVLTQLLDKYRDMIVELEGIIINNKKDGK